MAPTSGHPPDDRLRGRSFLTSLTSRTDLDLNPHNGRRPEDIAKKKKFLNWIVLWEPPLFIFMGIDVIVIFLDNGRKFIHLLDNGRGRVHQAQHVTSHVMAP